MNWRDVLPAVREEFTGKVSPDLLRQEARLLERRYAKTLVRKMRSELRMMKRQERKARRAGLR